MYGLFAGVLRRSKRLNMVVEQSMAAKEPMLELNELADKEDNVELQNDGHSNVLGIYLIMNYIISFSWPIYELKCWHNVSLILLIFQVSKPTYEIIL